MTTITVAQTKNSWTTWMTLSILFGILCLGYVYISESKHTLEIHEQVVARTQEVPDESGKLRVSTSSIGTGTNCVTIIQLYQAKSNYYYHEHLVFRNEPERIEMIPCSPK